MIFVLGGNGFIGSAFERQLRNLAMEYKIITRGNYKNFIGLKCDIIINANGNSAKYLASRDPKREFEASVSSVVASLVDFSASTYVYLSTGDVYPDQHSPEVTLENQYIDTERLSRYGLHKFFAEQYIRATHPNWLIFRMGGFVGPGLKKNAIYDILNGPQIWISQDSELQFLSTDRAAALVLEITTNGYSKEVINLGALGVVRVGDIRDQTDVNVPFIEGAPRVRFELSLAKLQSIVKYPLPTSEEEILNFLKEAGKINV